MEKRLSLIVDGSNTESDMSELLEHQKQKIRKLTEQRNDEIEKYNTAQREYYELVQKSDRALRPRIQAAFEKQKDNHNKRISHLTKKVENYRAKLKSKSIRKNNQSPSRPRPVDKQTSQPVDIILENRKLVSNRSSTSNLDDNHNTLEEHDLHDSTKSSKRASIAEIEHKNESARSDSILTHDLDAFVESAISESAIIRSLEAKTHSLHDRLEFDLLNEIEKFRLECLQHYSDSTDNEERLLERIRNLEKELYESNDNHQFEINNAKSMIQDLQEKLEYDCRRMNREFSEKLDNVYECIEKLEMGREKKLEAEKKQQADNEPVEGLKELLVNVLLGLFAIVLFCIKTVQFVTSPFMRSTSRTFMSIGVLLLSIVFWNSI